MTERRPGPLERLLEAREIETDQGPALVRGLDTILAMAKNAAGQTCPECGHHCKLFFGDPEGEHWCVCCQYVREFGECGLELGEEPT